MSSINLDFEPSQLLDRPIKYAKLYSTTDDLTPASRRYRKPLLWIFVCATTILVITVTYHLYSDDVQFLPNFAHHEVTFEPDIRFDGNPDVDSAWSNVMPQGMGFVKVPSKFQKGIGIGNPIDEEGSAYGVTVFHQLHCLAIIRATINALRSGDDHSYGSHDHDYMIHADHCVDYIRQRLMCSADLTFEHYVELADGKPSSSVDGWYINHKCKDWEQIVRFATAHRASNKTGII